MVSVILLSMPNKPVVPFPGDRHANRPANSAGTVSQLPSGPQIRAALDWFASHRSWIDDEQARLTEIPAPPFQEADRAAAVKVLLSAVGLEVSTDKAGNVIGLLRGASDQEVVVLSAMTMLPLKSVVPLAV